MLWEVVMFRRHQLGSLVYYIIPSFEETGLVRHCFTTKKGGVSKGEHSSLNLGLSRNDLRENVIKNFNIICNAIDINPKNLVLSDQVHNDRIYHVKKDDAGKGLWIKGDIKEVDALVTNIPNLALTTFFADCVPLYFLDPIEKVIAVAHAGWRGTVLKIGKKTVKEMVDVYGCSAKNILVAIGPSIGQCCYEVGKEVIEEFEEAFEQSVFSYQIHSGKGYVDLWKANKMALLEAGIVENNITESGLCTMCNKEEFFSHRGHNGKRGNLAAILQLIG